MELPALIVAVTFGGLMGWGLGWRNSEPLPTLAALLVGITTGAITMALDIGQDPVFVGGSLLVGCGAALAAYAPQLLRGPGPG